MKNKIKILFTDLDGTLLNTEVAVHVVGNDKPALIYQMLVLYMGA